MKKNVLKNIRSFSDPDRKRDTGITAEGLGLDKSQVLSELPIAQIAPNPDQPRRSRSAKKFEELKNSIRDRGILQPIRVLKCAVGFQIIAGEGRWRAASELGLISIPAVVVANQTPEQAYIDSLTENVIREDMNALDRAEALIKLRENLQKVYPGRLSWDELAESGRTGLNRAQIFNLLGLTKLPDEVKESIRRGDLTEKHGRALRLLSKKPDLFETAHRHILEAKLSSNDAIDYAKGLLHDAKNRKLHAYKIEYHSDAELLAALEAKVEELRSALSKRVSESPDHNAAS